MIMLAINLNKLGTGLFADAGKDLFHLGIMLITKDLFAVLSHKDQMSMQS